MNKMIFFICLILVLAVSWTCLAQERITITTYYPSPFGIYNQVHADRLAVGNNRAFGNSGQLTWGGAATSRGLLSTDQGSSIELGATTGVTPYIDFSRSSNNYDGRIIMMNTTTLGIYVADRVEVRRGTGANDYGDIVLRDLVLCQ